MQSTTPHPLLAALAGALILLAASPPASAATDSAVPQLLRSVDVVVRPGERLQGQDVLVDRGVIADIGVDLEAPAGARVWEFDSAPTLYPGLIEVWQEVELPDLPEDTPNYGHPNPLVQPERSVLEAEIDTARLEMLRNAGFVAVHLVPAAGSLRGVGALVSTAVPGDDEPARLLATETAQVAALETSTSGGYPNSAMGATALLRQTLADARWYIDARAAWQERPGQETPAADRSLEALKPVMSGVQPLIVDAEGEVLQALRAGRLMRQHQLRGALAVGFDALQYPAQLADFGLPVITQLSFPDPPDVDDEDAEADPDLSLFALRAWRDAPTVPARLSSAGVDLLLSTRELSAPDALFGAVAKAVEVGWNTEAALAALTTDAAKLLGVEQRYGTIEAGKVASFLVVDGELFVDAPAVREIWVDGVRYPKEVIEAAEVDPAGAWKVTLDAGGQQIAMDMTINGSAGDYSGFIEVMGNQLDLAKVVVSGKTAIITIDSSAFGGGNFELRMKIDGDSASGSGDSPQGAFDFKAKRSGPGGSVADAEEEVAR